MLLVAGSVAVNLTYRCETLPEPGETVRGSIWKAAGGTGLVAAVAAFRSGTSVSFNGCVGADDPGAFLQSWADSSHMQANLQVSPDAGTAVQTTLVDDQLGFIRSESSGANTLLAKSETLDAGIERAEIVLCDLGANIQTIMHVLHVAKDLGKQRVLHATPADPERIHQTLPLASLAVLDTPAFSSLVRHRRFDGFGDFTGEQVHALSDARLHELCRSTTNCDLLLNLGKRGVFVSEENGFRLVRPEGDFGLDSRPDAASVFAGVVASATASEDWGLRERTAYALRAVASYSVRGYGIEAIPWRAELE